MAFVKLDTGILNSTLWVERECREVFITALLMAEPYELLIEAPQIHVRSLDLSGWSVPPGWYGFVPAAGVGIVRRALVEHEIGMIALEKLSSPDNESRSSEFEGRRLVRIDGGYLVLNYMKYRDRDYTTADRSRRYRERKASRRDTASPHRDITQAEAEVEADKSKTERFALPDWIPDDVWKNFEVMRVKIRKPMTEHSKKLIVMELDKLRGQGFDAVMVLEQSVRNAWQDVFPVKAKTNGKGNNSWWSSEAGTLAKGKELNLAPRSGESMSDFRGRINEALGS